MQIVTTKAMAKVAAVATGLAMATSMLSLAPIAHAATCSVGQANLTVGSSGAAVTCLQQTLIADGYSIPAGATGYFGTQTRAAVSRWQSSMNIAPAVGYFGPISRAALSGGATVGTSTVAGCAAGAAFSATTGLSCTAASTVAGCAAGAAFSATTGQSCSTVTTYPAGCTSSVGFSPTTGVACSSGSTSTGGAITGSGYLTNVTSLGDVTSSLHEGDPTTAVVGASLQATNGDVALQRVDATFVVGSTGSQSVNLDRYVSDVSLWLGSTKIGDMNPSLGTLSGRTWTLRFEGLSNAVIKAGTTANLHVEVTPLTAIGTNESGNGFTAELLANSIRAVGGDGISDTYVSIDITQAVTVSSANLGTLTVSTASDNPNSSVVAVSSSTTTGVKLLSFNMKATNQNITVTDLVASFNTSDNNLNDVVNTVYLMQGSTVLQSKTLSTGTYGTVTFSSINQTIPMNSTENFTITADLKGDAAYADGTTVLASTTVAGWNVSDANGATVTPSSAAGGNAQTLTANGVSLALGTPTAVNVPTTISGQGDTGNYSIPFTVTAGNSDIFISAVTGTGIAYATTSSSNTAVTNQGAANLSVGPQVGGGTSGDVAGVAYKVPANTSRTFTLNVTYTATATGYTGLQLSSVAYGLTSGALTQSYTSNISTFKTNDINLVKH